MIPIDDEVRYKNIINLLKQIPKVKTPPNFESDLMRRINSGNFKDNYSAHWWEYFFLPSRLIPAASIAIAVITVFYFLNFNSIEQDNPFLSLPKIRTSVSQVTGKQPLHSKTSDYAEASVSTSIKINKEGLNFLHIRLNDAEKAKITNLKEQIRAYFNNNQ
jgi:hypothetical protein